MEYFNSASMMIEAAKSAELEGALQMVCDSSVGGEARYPQTACRELHKVIACQTYGPALYEMVQFLSAANELDGGWASLLWSLPKVTKSSCKAMFVSSDSPRYTVEAGEVIISYAGDSFGISYGRMPFLAALAEFVLSVTGYEKLVDAIFKFETLKEVRDSSNSLYRQMYDYLKDHLPSTQAHRKLSSLVEFLEGQHGAQFHPSSIADADILEFWLKASSEPESELRNFETVYRDFLRLGQAIAHGEDKAKEAQAKTLGVDREAGEIDVSDLDVWVGRLQRDVAILDAFDEKPLNDVKFLNKRERDGLALLFESGHFAQSWLLSFMRCEVFGAVQRRITQALRRKSSDADILNLCGQGADASFIEKQTEFEKIRQHLELIYNACLYAILCEQEDKVVRLTQAGDIADKLRDLKKAYGAKNRKGFETDPEKDQGRMAAFHCASDLLPEMERILSQWLVTWGQHRFEEGDAEQQFKADKTVFTHQFKRLYGKG